VKHPSYTPDCSQCKANAGETDIAGGVIWQNNLWLVRHAPPPYALAGWTMFNTQRHVHGPAHFTDDEAASYGPTLRHITRTLEEITGALRIYQIAFGESTPHMHTHLIPRYEDLPSEHIEFGIGDLNKAVASGAQPGVPEEEVLVMAENLRAALKASPPDA
jgi:diadenosine tetraphosphate (Ap4A) HIT family hydrolase